MTRKITVDCIIAEKKLRCGNCPANYVDQTRDDELSCVTDCNDNCDNCILRYLCLTTADNEDGVLEIPSYMFEKWFNK